MTADCRGKRTKLAMSFVTCVTTLRLCPSCASLIHYTRVPCFDTLQKLDVRRQSHNEASIRRLQEYMAREAEQREQARREARAREAEADALVRTRVLSRREITTESLLFIIWCSIF